MKNDLPPSTPRSPRKRKIKFSSLLFSSRWPRCARWLILLICPCLQAHQYDLTVCAMFKNEAPWLKEWIVYHHDILGVDHFYLYDNDSTDNFKAVLKPYIEQGFVELIDWNSGDDSHWIHGVADAQWMPCQLGAYNDCLKKRALGKAKWVAMIDIDEFIVPVKGVASLYKFLRKAEKSKKGTVNLSWRVFGTSSLYDLKPGELLTEKLTWRGKNDHPWHKWSKGIHRPEAVEFCQIHEALTLKPGYRRKGAKPDEIRINHYWARTEKYCKDRRNINVADRAEFFQDLKQVDDRAMLQYIPTLKKHLGN